MNGREKSIYRKEWLIVWGWALIVTILSINPIVYWKGTTSSTIFGFPAQYGYYILVMNFIIPIGAFIFAWLGDKLDKEIESSQENA